MSKTSVQFQLRFSTVIPQKMAAPMLDPGALESLVVNSFGAGLIGAIITAMLYGLTTLQTYLYFTNYSKDQWNIKLLVSIVWILDSLHVALVTYCIYFYLVINFANPVGLGNAHWSLGTTMLLNLILAVLVQSFFTAQVFSLSQGIVKWVLICLLSVTVLAHFAFGIETVVFLLVSKTFAAFQGSQTIKLDAATPFAIFAVLSDVLIAASLCVLLHGNRTGWGKTNGLITTLIIYAVNRCLLTSAVAITEVIVYVRRPDSLWFLAIDFIIGKLYANSLLASLNSRQALRQRSTERTSLSYNSSSDASSSLPQRRTPGQERSGSRKISFAPVSVALDTFKSNDRTTENESFHEYPAPTVTTEVYKV